MRAAYTRRMTHAITFADIEAAAQRLHGVAHRTPVLTSRTFDAKVGARVFFKCENLQRVGAFKFRGAYNALSQLDAQQRKRGVIAFSSGNHAQAVALAGRLLHVPTVIVMPHDTPPGKLAATREYQRNQAACEVVLYDRYTQDRAAIGRALAEERGMSLIPPFDHPHVIAGQGTAALELLQEVGELDVLITAVGGGGLSAGSCIAAHHLYPTSSVYGVEPEAGNDGQRSLMAGTILSIPTPVTIADGAQTTQLGSLTFPIMQQHLSSIVTVSDAQLVSTMRFFAERMKLVVEPTGCLAAAALYEDVLSLKGARIGVILSGGNIDMARYAQLLAQS